MYRRRLFASASDGFSLPLVLTLAGGAEDGNWGTGGDGAVESDDSSEESRCRTTDKDAPINIDAFPGIDEPPQDIRRPEGSPLSDQDYLGACMAREPSLGFEILETSGAKSVKNGGTMSTPEWVGFATTETEREELFGSRYRDVNVEEYVLVAVHGVGSSGRTHRWARVEDVPGGIHLHGYLRWTGLEDLRINESILKVERPAEDLECVRVSLTVTEDQRHHFDSEVSPVSIEEIIS